MVVPISAENWGRYPAKSSQPRVIALLSDRVRCVCEGVSYTMTLLVRKSPHNVMFVDDSVCGLTVTSQKATTKRTHHTHKGKDARRSLDSGLPHSLRQSDRGRQRRERATRAVSKNKQGPSTQAAQAPPFFKGCGDRERCQFPFLWKDRIRRI